MEIDTDAAIAAQINEETKYAYPRTTHWYIVPIRGTDKVVRARIEMIDEGSVYQGETIQIHEVFESDALRIVEEEAIYGEDDGWIATILRDGRKSGVAGYNIKWT